MNVYNFFKFIGEKRPEYELNSDNHKMISDFTDTFEYDVANDQFYDDNLGKRESLYFANGDKGRLDEKGRQGEFMKLIGSFSTKYDNGDSEHEFYYERVISNFKNDKKDGMEYYSAENDFRTITTERKYDNGNLVYRRDFYLSRGLERPYTKNRKNSNGENLVNAISYYEDKKEIRREKYYPNEIDGKQVMKSLHELIPCSSNEPGCFYSGNNFVKVKWSESFFSPEGKRVSEDEFRRIQNTSTFSRIPKSFNQQ